MKKKTIPFIFLIGVLLVLGNIFYNPTSTTIVKSNTYLTPANPAFDDDNFYKCITDKLGVSSDTNVTDEQLADFSYSLDCVNKNITSTKGLEKLTSLKYLNLSNNQLTSIDVSENTTLQNLNLYNNQLTSIDISNNTVLEYLSLSNNQLTSIDISTNTNLQNIDIDEDVEVIGSSDSVSIEYNPVLIFKNPEIKIKEGTYEYTLTVDNKIDKLSMGFDGFNKGYSYNCEDDTILCGGYVLVALMDSESATVLINDQNYHPLQSLYKIMNAAETTCNNEYPCNVYDDNEKLIGTIAENYYITIYKNNEKIGFYDIQNRKFYMFITNLEVGNNTLKITNRTGTYTINIIRKEEIQEENNKEENVNTTTSEEFNDILENLVDDKVNDNKVPDKTNEVINTVPNTGMVLSISLSVVAVILIGLLYYKYYSKKKTNIEN